MKRLTLLSFFLFTPLALLLQSCGLSSTEGQLTGVQGRETWKHPQPYGTVYVPTGSYKMGQSDQDVIYSRTARPKQVSVKAFFMDDTEITNNEYRQFVYWVRDSIAKEQIGGEHIKETETGTRLNWEKEIQWNTQEVQDMTSDLRYQGDNKMDQKAGFNTGKFVYKYKWMDLHEAAKRKYIGKDVDRSKFINEEEINIYPDTLAFIRDFTYSYNDPMAKLYFSHPGYDDYPVVGVNYHQAKAFSHWRTDRLNNYYSSIGYPDVNPFRLPTEAEWEYAARGGRDFSPYPWGGPYTRNKKGCFLANFKPLRGNYIEDGGFYPVKTDSYFPNDYGLYCMAGNVAEWTNTAYNESLYDKTNDMNPYYHYDADESEPVTRTRKVIRGGSWKDVAYYCQNGVRAYEYADTAKSYVGFRNVMTYMGRALGD